MDKNNPPFNFSNEDTQPTKRHRDRSLDVTQPMEAFSDTQPIFHEDKNANYQPIRISNSRLPLQRAPEIQPKKKRKGCGGCVLGLVIPVLAILIGYLLFPYRTNVLILGVDRTPEGTFVGRTDTMMLLSVIPLKPDVNLLSIPRDLWVNIPNYGENRINTAHFFAEANLMGTGPDAAMQTVRENFGVSVRYYVRFNFDGFKDIVNAMGGITIEIPEPMSGFEPGTYTLDGEQALAFARDRQSSDDFFRMQRGQMVLRAAVKQMLNPLSWPRIPQTIATGLRAVDTNVPFFEIPRIGIALMRAIVSDSINSQTITREMVYPTLTAEGANVLLPNWEMINPLLLEMFGE
ncbi:MAG: LCP family protein [Anaerolineaceae bacterium]|jgi:LCP family protein required for cell wall assembly|nr:LCP family protein [Anaerolineaceae bacterium]